MFKILVAWVWLTPLATGISVPTGKLTPITPAKPQPKIPPRTSEASAPSAPAPVVEYTLDHPEAPPLDPSYVPVTYKYLSALSPNSIFYVPIRYRNVHNLPGREVEYTFPRKYLGATTTLGKNDQYNYREKQPVYDYPTKPVYVPIKVLDFPSSTASKPVQASAPPTQSNNRNADYGFTTRDTDYTLPGNSDAGFYSKHPSEKYRQYLGYVQKNYNSKHYDVSGKGYSAAKGENYGAVNNGKEVDESRKQSQSAYPKKAVDLSPRKYYYHYQHKY